jgi:hypothetical protein
MAIDSLPAADPGLLFWLLALVNFVGLASTFLARLPQSHYTHVFCHRAFLGCLVFVGLATMFTICTQHNGWVWSGTTFSIMAVGATFDLGQAVRAPGF